MAIKSYRQAINEALAQEMRRDPRVIVMGEDNALNPNLSRRSPTVSLPMCGRLPSKPRLWIFQPQQVAT